MEMRDLTWLDADGRSVNLTYTPPDRYGMTMPGGKPDQYTIIGRDLFLLPASDGPGRLILTYYGAGKRRSGRDKRWRIGHDDPAQERRRIHHAERRVGAG